MGSNDRFYLMELRHRPALHGDVGSLLKIEGLVIGGEGAQAVLMLPGHMFATTDAHHLNEEQWSDWLTRSDLPEILVGGSLEKAFHRKARYEISGVVQQKVWVADGFGCMYCGKAMGKIQLTVDHFVPLELGGANDISNYLSACRKCNKDKGGMDPKEWIRLIGARAHTYEWYVKYLKNRTIP